MCSLLCIYTGAWPGKLCCDILQRQMLSRSFPYSVIGWYINYRDRPSSKCRKYRRFYVLLFPERLRRNVQFLSKQVLIGHECSKYIKKIHGKTQRQATRMKHIDRYQTQSHLGLYYQWADKGAGQEWYQPSLTKYETEDKMCGPVSRSNLKS